MRWCLSPAEGSARFRNLPPLAFARHQLVGQTLRDGSIVALKRPDGAEIACVCRHLGESDVGQAVLAGEEGSAQEACTWDTHISLVPEPPRALDPSVQSHLDVELEIFDTNLRHRLHSALTLAVHATGAGAVGMRPPDAILLHGPPGGGKTTLLRHTAAALGAAVISLDRHWFGDAPNGPRDPTRPHAVDLLSVFEASLREAEMLGGGIVLLEKAHRFLCEPPWVDGGDEKTESKISTLQGRERGAGHDSEVYQRLLCWLAERSVYSAREGMGGIVVVVETSDVVRTCVCNWRPCAFSTLFLSHAVARPHARTLSLPDYSAPYSLNLPCPAPTLFN